MIILMFAEIIRYKPILTGKPSAIIFPHTCVIIIIIICLFYGGNSLRQNYYIYWHQIQTHTLFASTRG
jgi:hypothetical protein